MGLQWGVDFPSKYRWGYDGGTKLAGKYCDVYVGMLSGHVAHHCPQDTPTVIQWLLSYFDLAVGGWVVGGW